MKKLRFQEGLLLSQSISRTQLQASQIQYQGKVIQASGAAVIKWQSSLAPTPWIPIEH